MRDNRAKMMEEWPIHRPLGHCCGTNRAIEWGEQYYAALVETEQGLQRRDFCVDYWQAEKPQVYCYWKTKMSPPGRKRQLFVDNEMLMAFFDRLAEETDQEKIDFRFVLSLVLMRKKRLKYDTSETEQGKEIWRLRKVGGGEFVEVLNPHLSEEQIEQLASQIGQILRVDL